MAESKCSAQRNYKFYSLIEFIFLKPFFIKSMFHSDKYQLQFYLPI